MMEFCTFIILSTTALFGLTSQVSAINSYKSYDLEHHIRKRNLQKEGYSVFEFATVSFNFNPNSIEKSFTHSRALRDASQQLQDSTIDFHINGDAVNYDLLLTQARTPVNQNTHVKVSNGDHETETGFDIPDCFLTGTVKDSPGESAILSFCDGLKGGFSNGTHKYYIETVDQDDDGIEEMVIVAVMEKPIIYDTYEPLSTEIPLHTARRKRAVLGSLNIETVIILDEEYVANMRAKGHSTNQSLVDLMAFKWAGVQAEWGRSDVLNYDITISVVEIVIWETNPSWYAPNTVLDNTLQSVCSGLNSRGLYQNADHIHLFTGRMGTDVAGKAYTGDICEDGRKCAVSTDTRVDEYVIPTHELGHSMGMAHDGDVGCPSPNDGIMGYKTAGWSSCSVTAMNLLVGQASASCLTTNDTLMGNEISIEESWPGMVYTDDDICEFKYGAGFRITSSRTSCSGDTCTNLDPSSPQYGISYSSPTPTDGSYCGEQMVCSSQIVGSSYKCINWTETGLDSSLFIVVVGGWSAWGSQTSCSRTCGAGIQYRQRYCNSPVPRNSAWCEGDDIEASPCNTQPCETDSTTESELIVQRAGETCTQWKTDQVYELMGKISSNYLNTGTKYGSSGNSQCYVKCDMDPSYSASGEKHGLMPDGTPCTPSILTSYEEVNGLPRVSGIYGLCVRGFCLPVGCNDVTGTVSYDGCGVCGGDNTTCQILEGVYDEVLPSKTRGIVAVLPTNAFRIQFYFTWSSMSYHFLEVRTKEDVAIINYMALDTRANPVTFAGTNWYLLATKQYLYADGPVDQAVVIKLYNFQTATNTGVNYAYSIPSAADMAACNETCENGGTFNTTTCSCDCAAGFYGVNCSTQCSKVCLNSQPTTSDLSNCKCDCAWYTYGTTCSCKYPFTGINCADCKITSCENGGTFNSTACRCDCPEGFGSLDCSTACVDASGNTAQCEIDAGKGWCESKNEKMEADCYKTCGLCIPSETTTQPTTTTKCPPQIVDCDDSGADVPSGCWIALVALLLLQTIFS